MIEIDLPPTFKQLVISSAKKANTRRNTRLRTLAVNMSKSVSNSSYEFNNISSAREDAYIRGFIDAVSLLQDETFLF